MIEKLRDVLLSSNGRLINDVKIENDDFIIEYGTKKLIASVLEINDLIKNIEFDLNSDEPKVKFEKTYEVLVETSGHIMTRENNILIVDNENNISYSYGQPSIEFAIIFLLKIKDNRELLRRYTSLTSGLYFERMTEECETVYEFIKLIVRKVETISLTSETPISEKDIKSRIDALTFDMSFNIGISITQVRFLSELLLPLRQRVRRKRIDEIDPLRRKYIEDLIYHYQMGMSTHHPALKFTSFYHVLEYFFMEVFNEQIVETVRTEITSPKFSSKRNSDINKLIKNIKNNLRIEFDDNVGRSEVEALKLTLMKYLKISDLVEELKEEYLDYYKLTEVQFSSGNVVDLSNEDSEKVFKSLANRIYKTRNAVVHSKADSKDCYIPFKHESQLLKEIPLIQIIAEEVIINTSKLL